MSVGGNSGIFYRLHGEGYAHPWDIAPEYQLLDNQAEGGPLLHQAGAVWDLYAPTRDVTRPIGEFNHACIIVRCGWVEHWMNGVKLLRFQLGSADFKKRHAASAHRQNPSFATAERGTIGLQDEGRRVSFRNIKIRPFSQGCEGPARVPTHIDSDTTNEIDDGFAILRALRASELFDATDFNSGGDRVASDFLLKSGAPLYIMPVNQLGTFKFDRNRFEQAAQGPLEIFNLT